MTDTQQAPFKIRPGEGQMPPDAQAPGVKREVLYAGDGVMVTHITLDPATTSPWHHHGDYDTFIWPLDIEGDSYLEYGTGGSRRLDNEAGELVFIPAGAVHREVYRGSSPGQALVFRVGRGTPVVVVDGPEE